MTNIGVQLPIFLVLFSFYIKVETLGLSDLLDLELPVDLVHSSSHKNVTDGLGVTDEDGSEIFHINQDELSAGEEIGGTMTFDEAEASLDTVTKNSEAVFTLEDTEFIMDFIKNCSRIFKTFSFPVDKGLAVEDSSGFTLTKAMETFGMTLASALGTPKNGKRSMPLHWDGLWMDVTTINITATEDYHFPTSRAHSHSLLDSVVIPKEVLELEESGSATIITAAYVPFHEMTYSVNHTDKRFIVDGKVLSTVVKPKPRGSFKKNITLIFRREKINIEGERLCVFWDFDSRDTKSGGWSTKGCKSVYENQTHTVCQCNHLTDFSVLFRVTEKKGNESISHRVALKWISVIGCSITIVTLTMSIFVLLLFRRLFKSDRNVVHFNLALCLLIANVLFLASDKAKENEIACALVTTGMLFFFLAAFAWMLMEGIFIWIKLVNVFSNSPPVWLYFAVSYGFAAFVCAVASAVLREDIIHPKYCWLPVTRGAIWAFVGPALAIILINLVVLVRSLFISMDHQKDNLAVTTLRTAAKLMILLTPILGFTWLFGIFSVNEDTVIFQYLFTVLNSLQGLFIFIIYVVKNNEVHHEYFRYLRRRTCSTSVSRFSSGNHANGTLNQPYLPR